MNPKELVSANIRARRRTLGLSQSETGARLGWTQQGWGMYEKGERSIGVEVLADIARALETTMAELVSNEIVQSKKAQARRRKAA